MLIFAAYGLALLHVLLAGLLGQHAMRTGRRKFWLWVLYGCPLLGGFAYVCVIYRRPPLLTHAARLECVSTLDPRQALLHARAAFERNSTMTNQMRLAQALLEADRYAEAALRYEACLNISFASDLGNRLGAARAWVKNGDYERAMAHLQIVRAKGPNYKPEQVSLLMAQALAGEGCCGEARMEFEFVISQFGSDEARTEYDVWRKRWLEQAEAAGRVHRSEFA